MGITTGAASIMARLKVPTSHPSIPIRGRASPLEMRKKWFKSQSTTTIDIDTEALTAPCITHAIDAAVAVASSSSSSSIAFAVAWWALLSPEWCSAASLSSIAIATEPTNALSLPTWAIHVSSVAEWVTAMSLVWEYGEKSGFSSWKGLSWGMVPLLGGALCACTWHFFYNSESLEILVALQAALTVVGNFTMCVAAYRIYKSSHKGSPNL